MKRLVHKSATTNFHYVAKASFKVELQDEIKPINEVITDTEYALFDDVENSAQEKIKDEITNIDVDIANDKKYLIFDIWFRNAMTKEDVKKLVEDVIEDANDSIDYDSIVVFDINGKFAEASNRKRKSIFAEYNSNEKILKILEDSMKKIKQQNVDLDSIKDGAQKIIDEINKMNK